MKKQRHDPRAGSSHGVRWAALGAALVMAGGCNFRVDESDAGDDGGSSASPTSLGTIARIQTGEFWAGEQLVLEAVITGIEYDDTGSPNYTPIGIHGLFVADLLDQAEPYSGIYAELPVAESLGQYEIGDRIAINGRYGEYYDASQINVTDIRKLGEAPVPVPVYIEDPTTVRTLFAPGSEGWSPTRQHGEAAEAHEGVLIEVRDVAVIVGNLGHGMFAVTGGLAIDTQLYYLPPPHTEGTRYASITGILTYNFDAFKLAPRSYDDFVTP